MVTAPKIVNSYCIPAIVVFNINVNFCSRKDIYDQQTYKCLKNHFDHTRRGKSGEEENSVTVCKKIAHLCGNQPSTQSAILFFGQSICMCPIELYSRSLTPVSITKNYVAA
ncbi:uncharacterized protein LOC120359274 [Solenopsis invicta]|uniref:uncharacterized protein LOC120359274 n=1 Tax=Solenopsis invicta TaxID=13686 RepID=UPI00193DA7D1|nr:uncharacterized protein LOC120359274 [Solenopsis invicta]XP_039312131.1 uncharacterized protein LOC120359274 [Solenopsis invicta]XP_039312132.1 uncharacterized protein LOC120359274 [Solenopsis invicta]